MPEQSIILFDGVCNYCNSMVNFVIQQDKNKKFKFAALQSEAGQKILQKCSLPTQDFDSFILIENGKVFKSSTAGLKVLNKLPVYWKWSQVFWIVPKFLRDAVYNVIAKNRYKWFGRKETCMIPSPQVKERFLD
jgi:predicted DCC family thiol-disulfide oxidoreductase YuxK